jgi:dihydropteroate synthase-like protein
MKVLLVTGRLAEASVRRHALQSKTDYSVVALPVSVASLLTPEAISRFLVTIDLKGYDMIMIPGLVRGDASIIEETVGISAFKGPRYSADIPVVLGLIDRTALSKTAPADAILRKGFAQQVLHNLATAEDPRFLRHPGNILVGSVAVGRDYPARVVAEILDAPTLSDRELVQRAKYYAGSGAKIIDIGMMTGSPQPEEASRAVKAVKDSGLAPAIAIDTSSTEEAEAAVDSGADLILSLDASTMVEAASFAIDVAVVIIPSHGRGGISPKEPQARLEALAANVAKAQGLGYEKIVADPIVDPLITPGLGASIASYGLFADKFPDVPLLFGAGNVTELLDADSIGANALLAGLAAEAHVGLLLTTEGSDKTRGAVRELATACEMMFLAKKRSSVPKDLGLDLLVLKEKRRAEEAYEAAPADQEKRTIIEAEPGIEGLPDPAGSYRIVLDRSREEILAIRYVGDDQRETIKGGDAATVYMSIAGKGLVSQVGHAAYLGSELTKAEIALRTGRSYVQDRPLFSEDGRDEN